MIKINQSNCYYCYDKDRVSPEKKLCSSSIQTDQEFFSFKILIYCCFFQ